MDRILKLVYDNWSDEGIPLPNGRHRILNDLIKSGLRTGIYKSLTDAQTKILPQFDCNVFFFDHSNFWEYFNKSYPASNIVKVSQVEDDAVYLWPIEIRTTIEAVYQTHSLTIDNQHITYNIIDTIDPILLKLMQLGKVKILIGYAHDPINNYLDLERIEELFKSYGIEGSNIIIVSGNDYSKEYRQACPSSKIKIIPSELMITQQVAASALLYPRKTSLGYLSDLVREENLTGELRSKRFICFNRTMRPHRYALAYIALKLNLLENSIFSFLNKFDHSCVSVENELKKFNFEKDTKSYSEKICNMIPYEIDTQHLIGNDKTCFSIENSKKELYTSSYIHIVSETRFLEGVSSFISEKTWRPINNLQPFIMVSSPNMLEKLHNLGFKTFHPFIDESYDNELDYSIRMSMIYTQIEKLNNMPLQELHDWYYSIIDILVYNQAHLRSFADINPFEETFNSIIKEYHND
jgi:hypothetical protein